MIKLKSKESKENVKIDLKLKDVTTSEYLGGVFGLIDSASNNLGIDLLSKINSHYGMEVKNERDRKKTR